MAEDESNNKNLPVMRDATAEMAVTPLPSVLVVEDNEFNQDVIRQQIGLLGLEVDVVGSGQAALDAMAKKDFDVVLMDCQMFGMDGFETTRCIRKREGTARHTRVIALTANSLEGDREKCLDAGMDAYLSKPAGLEELEAVIMGRPWPEQGSQDAPPPPQVAEHLPVDLNRLQRISGGTREGLHETVNSYLQEMEEALPLLQTAIRERNTAEVARHAHSCLGTSTICGVKALVQPLREMEDLGRRGDLGLTGKLYSQIEAEFELVKKYLKEKLD